MVTIPSLLLPIVLSAVVVFVVSSIIHMVLPYHRTDFAKLPQEDAIRDALQPFDVPPGEYVVPHAATPQERKAPEFLEKVNKGPVAFMTFLPKGMPSMAGPLVQWFVYCVVVGGFAAYIAGRALGPGAEYLAVFRFVGCTALVGYTVALWQSSIWYKRPWSTTIKHTIDGAVYALLTAGVFGWLWPG